MKVDHIQLPQASVAQRWLSVTEFAAGSVIVIGHNVYRVFPNEVPILAVMGLVSLRLRNGGWAEMGLRRPVSWKRTLLFAVGAAALRILLGSVVIDPVTAHFWPPAAAPAGTNEIAGHVFVAL